MASTLDAHWHGDTHCLQDVTRIWGTWCAVTSLKLEEHILRCCLSNGELPSGNAKTKHLRVCESSGQNHPWCDLTREHSSCKYPDVLKGCAGFGSSFCPTLTGDLLPTPALLAITGLLWKINTFPKMGQFFFFWSHILPRGDKTADVPTGGDVQRHCWHVQCRPGKDFAPSACLRKRETQRKGLSHGPGCCEVSPLRPQLAWSFSMRCSPIFWG